MSASDISIAHGVPWPTTIPEQLAKLRSLIPLLKGEEFAIVRDTIAALTTSEDEAVAVLTRHLKEDSNQKLAPFRVLEAQLLAERRSIESESTESQARATIEMAKAHQLTVDEALLLSYVQFGKEPAHKFMVGILHRKSGLPRIVAHNFFVAGQADPSFLATWGSVLAYCPYPLFPVMEEFGGLNRVMLSEVQMAQTSVTGGDPSVSRVIPRPSVYKQAVPVVGGEYWVPVQRTPAGDGVDLSIVEETVRVLQAQVADLGRRAQPYNGPGRSNNYRGASRARGRGDSNRGRGRDAFRPRRGYTGPRGGADTDSATSPKTCFGCGEVGHVVHDCPVQDQQHSNIAPTSGGF